MMRGTAAGGPEAGSETIPRPAIADCLRAIADPGTVWYR
jgi:hypothetical protein